MKDVSVASTRHSRPSVYPRKRPSPHGVSKAHKTTPLLPSYGAVRRSPRSAKSALLHQRQREAQIVALRKEGVLLEEEYREEIRFYMHDMEVSYPSTMQHRSPLAMLTFLSSVTPFLPLSQWINSLK
jgi:hypothetical protein